MERKDLGRLELRAIMVSYRSALPYVPDVQRDLLRDRALQLLANLELRVRSDGTDPAILAEIADARTQLG
jgi:hypothetical protein